MAFSNSNDFPSEQIDSDGQRQFCYKSYTMGVLSNTFHFYAEWLQIKSAATGNFAFRSCHVDTRSDKETWVGCLRIWQLFNSIQSNLDLYRALSDQKLFRNAFSFVVIDSLAFRIQFKTYFFIGLLFLFEKQHYDLRDIESLRQFKDIVFFKSIRNPQFYLPDINGELCIKG